MEKTVSAIATAQGVGGVAIIRLSGPLSLKIAEDMFIPAGKTAVKNFEPYKMYAGDIDCGTFKDFGLCVYFKAPKSYTGEDVVELHCHGGVSISRGALKRTFALGASPAGRGEFTRRAFLNGKLSLSAAEGLGDMINAESEAEVRAGFMLYNEGLCAAVKRAQGLLTDCLAGIDASLDYPEEDIEEEKTGDIAVSLQKADKLLSGLLSTYTVGKKIKSGVSVAICGKPNTGKSSILNALLGYEKAIVSSVEGTTRDAVEGCIEIDGVKFNLYDTAGIRGAADEVESIGISMAEKIIASADIVLFVNAGAPDGEYRKIAEGLKGKQVIRVVNKTDEPSFDICRAGEADVYTSAVTGEGIGELRRAMAAKAVPSYALGGAFLLEERHFDALKRAEEFIARASLSAGKEYLELVAADIKAAWDCLGEITGETATEEIITQIFSKFCVGK